MKIETYKCDVCKEETQRLDLMSIYWNSLLVPPRYSLNGNLNNSGKHICLKCIEMIKEAEI